MAADLGASDSVDKWADYLNQQLSLSVRSGTYACIKVLLLYWQEGNEAFKTEGHELGRMFQDIFNYPVDEYPIPSSQSYLCLNNVVTQTLLNVAQTAEVKKGASLLIIHYGGHGDRNDQKHEGEEKRSVWAAHRIGGPTLEWFRIQDHLKFSDSDILLLLDCCYGAQAGRARENRHRALELLAAAAMGVETPMPGPRSFTLGIKREMANLLKDEGYVTTTALHQRLVDRKANLYATPFYMTFTPKQKTIRLDRFMPEPSQSTSQREVVGGPCFQLLIQANEPFNNSTLDEISRWLCENIPTKVTTIHVEKIIRTTGHIHDLIKDFSQNDQPLTRGLDILATEELLALWENSKVFVNELLMQERTSIVGDTSTIWPRVRRILNQLNAENTTFLTTLERDILNSSLFSDEKVLEEAIESPTAEALGIVDQLRLRRIVCSTSISTTESGSFQSKPAEDVLILQEYKTYGPYVNPADIPELTVRVQRLATLLRAPKSPEFRSLICRHWYHKPTEDQYVLEFEIPPLYEAKAEGYETLQSLIQKTRGSSRPSLNGRFKMAFLLAIAVLKWHYVGWVHQGISSLNILFLPFKDSSETDYSSPFLQGFEFARPDSDPSIGRPTDDIAFRVYRHSDRQGNSRKGHRKIHDIYSLGVVLLEIGLWQSASEIAVAGKKPPISGASIQKSLLKATSDRLGHYAGTSYKAAVEACLTSNFDVALDDENESQLARSFQGKVIDALAKGITVQ